MAIIAARLLTSFNQVFRDAMHIVQLHPFPRVRARSRSVGRSPNIAAAQGQRPSLGVGNPANASTDNVMILEYLRLGSLHKMIETATGREIQFPDRVLWKFFHDRKPPTDYPPCAVATLTAQSFKLASQWHTPLLGIRVCTPADSRPLWKRFQPECKSQSLCILISTLRMVSSSLVGRAGRTWNMTLIFPVLVDDFTPGTGKRIPLLKMSDFGLAAELHPLDYQNR